jgi:hypothetical protein
MEWHALLAPLIQRRRYAMASKGAEARPAWNLKLQMAAGAATVT